MTLGFQELPQLEADYSKVGKDKIITTVGNVISGSARSKDTLDWLSGDIFGKVVQLKKGITIDRDRTSINLNENMDSLVPASKISDKATNDLLELYKDASDSIITSDLIKVLVKGKMILKVFDAPTIVFRTISKFKHFFEYDTDLVWIRFRDGSRIIYSKR